MSPNWTGPRSRSGGGTRLTLSDFVPGYPVTPDGMQ
jgi:hypothetical protein